MLLIATKFVEKLDKVSNIIPTSLWQFVDHLEKRGGKRKKEIIETIALF